MNGANWIDILLAAIMLLSVGLATLRGLLHSVFGLAAAALAFIVALRRGDFFAPWLESALGTSASVSLSYAAVFVLALLVFGAVGKMIRATARKLDLGGLDRVGGFVFGLLRGGLAAVVVVLVIGALPLEDTRAWRESKLTPVAGGVAFMLMRPGGFLETELWRFDERRRPSLHVFPSLPTTLPSDSLTPPPPPSPDSANPGSDPPVLPPVLPADADDGNGNGSDGATESPGALWNAADKSLAGLALLAPVFGTDIEKKAARIAIERNRVLDSALAELNRERPRGSQTRAEKRIAREREKLRVRVLRCKKRPALPSCEKLFRRLQAEAAGNDSGNAAKRFARLMVLLASYRKQSEGFIEMATRDGRSEGGR